MRRKPLAAWKLKQYSLAHTKMSEETRSYNVEEAVEDWVLSISPSEIDNCLSQLELRRNGNMFAKLDRLYKWVLDTYDPREYVESEEPGDEIARRKSLRDGLLRKTLSEDDGTFVQMSNWDIHPSRVSKSWT